jgi:hypothetical protein
MNVIGLFIVTVIVTIPMAKSYLHSLLYVMCW